MQIPGVVRGGMVMDEIDTCIIPGIIPAMNRISTRCLSELIKPLFDVFKMYHLRLMSVNNNIAPKIFDELC